MTGDLKFKDDGSIRVGNVWFRPVTPFDAEIALHEQHPNKYARYDAFNTDGSVFCGLVNLYYDRNGYWRFLERRDDGGEVSIRIIDLPAKSLFAAGELPKDRRELTKAMLRCSGELHANADTGEWVPLKDPAKDLQQRYASAAVEAAS